MTSRSGTTIRRLKGSSHVAVDMVMFGNSKKMNSSIEGKHEANEWNVERKCVVIVYTWPLATQSVSRCSTIFVSMHGRIFCNRPSGLQNACPRLARSYFGLVLRSRILVNLYSRDFEVSLCHISSMRMTTNLTYPVPLVCEWKEIYQRGVFALHYIWDIKALLSLQSY